MPIQGQDLLNLCALAAQNEDLIVNVGKMALNFALSPQRAAFDIVTGVAGLVFNGLTANSQQRGNCLTPSGNSRYSRKMSACDFIKSGMNSDQQDRLTERISNVLGGRNRGNSYNDLLSMILNNPNLRNQVVGEIKKFLESENLCCSRRTNDCYDDDDCCYDVPCYSRSKSCSRY
ncbi:hypothetical protein HHI36_003516 [Cryptolaemus montrouzieri]|uniref:Uncharacterized protein n=1 Tax=Cryptolaemus montrouzieri TaxID=559131 RepID=A0ABD2PE56_9CUCU